MQDDGQGGDGDGHMQQGRRDGQPAVTPFMRLGLAAPAVSRGLETLGLLLDTLLIGGILGGDLGVTRRSWAHLIGGQGVKILLQALGLIEIPRVRGLVLLQHRLVLRDDGLVALGGFQAGADRRGHRQDGDGEGDLREQGILGLDRFGGAFGAFSRFGFLERRFAHGSTSFCSGPPAPPPDAR